MIELKTPAEIERMRQAGRVVAELLEALSAMLKPGLRTKDLDEAARAFIKSHGAKPAFLGYRGFPACVCVSVNEEVVHGIPGDRQLRAGDLVSLDAGAVVEGFYADAAVTRWVGSVPAASQRLVETTRQALEEGIAQAVEGKRLADISQAVQRVIESAGFGIVREFVGHGIGRALHEDPPIPNFVPVGVNPRLRAGMVLAIEPMVTMGRHEVEVLSDGWTAVTKDRSLAAHWEHTVAVTSRAPDILTQLPDA
ncbi:MAG: type I methionyl aminopeptidase [Candidatus Omnitrophica bacterium CG11_big_fil_rev_8_21_14_0_20_63_9]|nr:MAG: type I methionyl aminopeptidase [Candidatus Omnitrophica bacterium CG11_big_fil_rev_8_21_14_0_20_63_9]